MVQRIHKGSAKPSALSTEYIFLIKTRYEALYNGKQYGSKDNSADADTHYILSTETGV